MDFKNWFDKAVGKIQTSESGSGSDEDYVELEPEELKKSAKIYVKYFVLNDFPDVKPVIDALRDGYTVCFVKISPLRNKDINELKRAVKKIKRTCSAIDGNVVGIDEGWIIATPNFVEVYKGEEEEAEEAEFEG